MENSNHKNEKIEIKCLNTQHDLLISYFLEPIRNIVGGFKDKVVSLFQKNTQKDYGKQIMYGRGKKLSKPKTQKPSEDNIIKYTNIFLN